MNMLIRFFIMMSLLKKELKNNPSNQLQNNDKTAIILAPFSQKHRILPHDMGFRNHLPNYRYLSFIELNITGWLTTVLQAKYGKEPTAEQKLMWIISMQEVVYLKEVFLFNKLTVTSKIEGWDSKYIYFQHHFYVKGQLMAIGLTKFILMSKKGKQPPSVLGLQGEQLTDVITTWNANQKAIKEQINK